MLTYSYKIPSNLDRREIPVNDFHISHDMSYVSGTTDYGNSFGVDDKISVETEYYPELMDVTVSTSDTVKRNGYITYKKKMPISLFPYVDYYSEEPKMRMIRYIETDGDTYFQDFSTKKLHFVIGGIDYYADSSSTSLDITEKAYVEDGHVNIDGITYNVLIDSNAVATNVFFSDFEGNPFTKPITWGIENINPSNTYVRKFSVENGETMSISTKSIRRYGYRPYILYNGDRLELHYLYNEDGSIKGFGLNIDGKDYIVVSTDVTPDSDIPYINPYDKSMYGDSENVANSIEINGRLYCLFFEPDEVVSGDIIAVRANENLPILIGDRLTLKSSSMVSTVRLESDDLGHEYITINGARYERIKNLCDCVDIDGREYDLEYGGNSDNVTAEMGASCILDDGSMLYFKVVSAEEGKAKTLRRVLNNGSGNNAYTISVDNNGNVVYTGGTIYTVKSYDGVSIDGAKYRIFDNYNTEANGTVWNYGSYVNVGYSPQYNIKLIDVIGSDRYVCKLDIDRRNYLTSDYNSLVDSIIDEITSSNSFSLYKTPNTFGRSLLSYYEWIPLAIESNGPSSIYGLSDIMNKIKFKLSNSFLSIPVNLSKSIDYSLSKSDGITSIHYGEMADETINPIVDMEKDMYTPVFMNEGKTSYIDVMEFNFHFRTRDLETWKIIGDEGMTSEKNESDYNVKYDASLSNVFSNWFMTDYYPYNAFREDRQINAIMNNSDLLGFLYFTTNDVKVKRKKLEKSFLRVSYYDSKDPLRQNLLGTSTIYFDCDSYFDTLYNEDKEYFDKANNTYKKYFYGDVAMSTDTNRTGMNGITDGIWVDENAGPSVLREPFWIDGTRTTDITGELDSIKMTTETKYLSILNCDDIPRLGSRMRIFGRYEKQSSNEGFYSYILKAFSDKKIERTIYMKFEFFHAGVGIKIPMLVATDSDRNAIDKWDYNKLEAFKKGYALNEIYDRLYVPIKISYSKDLRKFVYMISDENKYDKAIKVEGENKLRFNLFELKTKTS